MQYWLVKQEPEEYSWADLVRDGRTIWSGVRNFQARNNLKAMKKGDLVLFYHSVTEKSIVGLARVLKEAFPERTRDKGDWVAVEIAPHSPLPRPVTLDEIKANRLDIPLVKNSRLSVMPIPAREFERLLLLAGCSVPAQS